MHRSRINPSWLHDKVRPSLSNGYGSEDENAENSASEERERLLGKKNQHTSAVVASGGHVRNQKRKEAQDLTAVIERFNISSRNRFADTGNTLFFFFNIFARFFFNSKVFYLNVFVIEMVVFFFCRRTKKKSVISTLQ